MTTKKKSGNIQLEDETIATRVPISEMVVDAEYQGHVSEALVEKIASNWNDSAAGAIVLNLRDDNSYAVLDGQHRVLAAQKVGVADLSALVFIGKSRAEEATLFVLLNTKHNVQPYDRFRANLLAGKTEERSITHILGELGLVVTDRPNLVNGVRCTVALKKIYTSYGPGHLRLTAGVLQAAFGNYPTGHQKGYSDGAFLGMAQFLYRFPEADKQRVINKLKAYTPVTVQGIAAAKVDPGQQSWMGWGKAFTSVYNSGFRATYSGYLQMSRWDKMVYTPAGKAVQQKDGAKKVKQFGPNTLKFKAGVPRAEQESIKRAAKTQPSKK